MYIDVLCEGGTQIDYLRCILSLLAFHLVSINILTLTTKWSTGQKELDHPFKFHFDLNTKYSKVLSGPMHRYKMHVIKFW